MGAIYNIADFEDQLSMYTFVGNRFDDVVTYLEEQPFAEFSKTVRAVPLEQFTPIINAKLAQRSGSKEEKAELNELLAIVTEANTVGASTRATPVGKKGYAIYVDGVNSSSFYEWHTGIVTSASTSGTVQVIAHAKGMGHTTEVTDLAGFLESNSFMGTYRKTSTTSTLNSIGSTALNVANESISYCVMNLIETKTTVPGSRKIEVSDIYQIRCDGLVEYAYEYNGQIIRGGDISTNAGMIADNNMTVTFTPKHQASKLTKVS